MPLVRSKWTWSVSGEMAASSFEGTTLKDRSAVGIVSLAALASAVLGRSEGSGEPLKSPRMASFAARNAPILAGLDRSGAVWYTF